MDIEVLGLDLGKSVCGLAELDVTGVVVFRKRLQRNRLLNFLEKSRPMLWRWKSAVERITSGGFTRARTPPDVAALPPAINQGLNSPEFF